MTQPAPPRSGSVPTPQHHFSTADTLRSDIHSQRLRPPSGRSALRGTPCQQLVQPATCRSQLEHGTGPEHTDTEAGSGQGRRQGWGYSSSGQRGSSWVQLANQTKLRRRAL